MLNRPCCDICHRLKFEEFFKNQFNGFDFCGNLFQLIRGALFAIAVNDFCFFADVTERSNSSEEMSQNLGKQSVLSGSVSRSAGKDGSSRSLQMIERPLMTVDEPKSMPKGYFIVVKTGCYPMKTRLKLFFKWGIQFEDAYSILEKSERKV
ncbi:MAG: type IV secretory system conjugative DNA transfer family protein [Oscillospiraceae bacterium]|nr:type IV secretory system conjugative DNA transfer family protein [Oscillospiraceae bacterium]